MKEFENNQHYSEQFLKKFVLAWKKQKAIGFGWCGHHEGCGKQTSSNEIFRCWLCGAYVFKGKVISRNYKKRIGAIEKKLGVK